MAALIAARFLAAKDEATFAAVFIEFQNARNPSERIRDHEQYLLDQHLATVKCRKVQDVSATDVGEVLRTMRDTHSEWTRSAVYRLLNGTFSLAKKRKFITDNPVWRVSSTRNGQRRTRRKSRSSTERGMEKLVAAA